MATAAKLFERATKPFGAKVISPLCVYDDEHLVGGAVCAAGVA